MVMGKLGQFLINQPQPAFYNGDGQVRPVFDQSASDQGGLPTIIEINWLEAGQSSRNLPNLVKRRATLGCSTAEKEEG